MIKKINISFFTGLSLLLGFCLQAQEQLMPLNANGQLILAPVVVKNTLASKTMSITPLDTLPFFDDFSYSVKSPYPSGDNWIDSSVFINHGFPIAPPSIGVATFDGLNKKGYPYSLSALVSSSAQADRLTSKPINLKKSRGYEYSLGDSLYLSFYYQAEGRGDAPEANDSLSLDFFIPKQNKWLKVWGRKGYNPGANDSLFHRVMVPVDSIVYLDSLFQFRFRNRATLSGSLDHWHIDYIYLNKGRTNVDTVMEDDAFQYMSSSFLKNYATMPFKQYLPSEMAPTISNYIRNNFTSGKNTTYSYTVSLNSVSTNTYNGGSANIPPYNPNGMHSAAQHSNPGVSFSFPLLTDMSIFTIKHVISSSPDLQRQNDTIVQTQRFSDYYAYDDGTAEVGYYNNTYGAKNAVRYTLNAPDTLRALRVYFDPITDGHNIINSTFNIMVWSDGNNGPGSLIYSDSTNNESHPMYLQGRHNIMPTYPLSACLPLNPGTYYFGIKQKTNKPLNIGFDKNNDHSSAFYYDIGGGWVQSAIKGSIMINPLMGCALDPLPVSVKDHAREGLSSISVYPNPAQNSFRIETHGVVVENATVTILSSIGQSVYTASYNSNESIDVSNLSNGIYFIQLNSSEINAAPQKLIISR